MRQHVFISYVRENRDQVDRLRTALEEHEISVWLDRDSILPGMRWKKAIQKAITDGAFFLACFSTEYADRDRSYMNEELELAIDELRQRPRDRAFFIPVIVSPTDIPDLPISARESLTDLQWVDLTNDWETGVQGIINVVQSVTQLPFASLPEAFDAVQAAERQLKERFPAVSSIALDRKVVGFERTTTWCIRVYVKQKAPMHEIVNPLPVEILGLPVDVVEEGDLSSGS